MNKQFVYESNNQSQFQCFDLTALFNQRYQHAGSIKPIKKRRSINPTKPFLMNQNKREEWEPSTFLPSPSPRPPLHSPMIKPAKIRPELETLVYWWHLTWAGFDPLKWSRQIESQLGLKFKCSVHQPKALLTETSFFHLVVFHPQYLFNHQNTIYEELYRGHRATSALSHKHCWRK